MKIALPLAFASGAAALVYETVWLRMLVRLFGITVHAVGFATAFFLLGLALGAAIAGKLTLRPGNWLKIYGFAEAALAALAYPASLLLSAAPALSGGNMAAGCLLAGCAILIPSMLMGATLPLLLRACESGLPERDIALVYGVNTLGAVAGTLLAGFFTIAVFGEKDSVLFALSANAGCALSALVLSAKRPPNLPAPEGGAALSRDAMFVLALMAVSGFCAAGYQVLWSRLLTTITGTSIYAFAAMLAVLLGGMGAGSCAAAKLLPKLENPMAAFGLLEIGLAALAACGLVFYRAIGLLKDSPLYLYSPMLSWTDALSFFSGAAVIVAPAAFVMGLIFPLAAGLCAPRSGGAGYVTGRLYLWNTAGCVVGALAAGFALVGLAGVKYGYALLIALNCIIGLAALSRAGVRLSAAAAVAALAIAAAAVPGDPYRAVILNRCRAAYGDMRLLFHEDAASGTVTGVEHGGARTLLINGIIISGNGDNGKVMMQIPAAMNGRPRRALVICFGAGGTFRAASRLAEKTDVVELSAAVLAHAADFSPDAALALRAPGARVFVKDGRNYLLSSRDKYDVIVVDASPPVFSAGAVNLYSKEFLELAKTRLSGGGIYALWLPLPCHEYAALSIIKGFAEVFAHQAVWAHPNMSGGFLVMGSGSAFEWPAGELDKRLSASWGDSSLPRLTERALRGSIAAVDGQISGRLAAYPAVTDDRPLTEFPLGRFWRGEPLMADPGFLRAVF